MTLVDTHAHLDSPEFDGEVPQLLDRAAAAGVTRILSVGTDGTSSRRALALAERHPGVHAVVGWHPGHASEAPQDLRAELRALAAHPRVAAIGECGLDYYRLPSRVGTGGPGEDAAVKAQQARIFEQQLEVAGELGLNVVIHTREAWADTVAQFAPHAGRIRAVFHCFAGGPDELETVRRLGSLVSFTGIVTFKNGGAVRAALAAAMPGGYMLETDCPYLAPEPHRGRRCEPAHVRPIAERAAEVTGRPLEAVAAETSRTAESFFRGLGRG
ncbi:MAG: TatD family hydrolase [Verrucomicrobia bacterium]|nr:TatD family hydrolase [Verrucomicrobiota bacterium]